MRLSTACPLDCPDTCSLEVEVQDGRLISVDAGPANPLTQGFICAKVKHHARRVYAPERVLTPLVRTGPKGSGSFRSASWDEALDLVAAQISTAIAESGPDSVVPYLYNSSVGSLGDALTWQLFDDLGVGAGVAHDLRGDSRCGVAVDVRVDAVGRSPRRGAQPARRRVGREPRDLQHPLSAVGAESAGSGSPTRRRGSAAYRDGQASGSAPRASTWHRRRVGVGHRRPPRRA